MTTVTVEDLLGGLREFGTIPPPSWGPDTKLTEIRDRCGDFALAMLIAHVEQATSESGPWPIDLLDACDTLGMLADFAEVRS